MMKSFFKKLAFVMALAMVVTLAAPAAKTAVAADEKKPLGITYQADKTYTISEVNLAKVGATEDLRFLYAPTNWKELGWKWTSSNENVVTVDNNGVITGIAAGKADVTVAIGTESATVTVYVEDTQTYTAKMGTDAENLLTEWTLEEVDDTIDLNFYGIKDYARDDYNGTGTPRYFCEWDTTDPEVATVDNKGLVTAVAPGKAKITLIVWNLKLGTKHNVDACWITVPEPEVIVVEPDEDIVRGINKTQNKVDLTFNKPVDLKLENVALYYIFTAADDETGLGEITDPSRREGYLDFYVKGITPNDDKTVWTVETFDDFTDEAFYKVTVKGYEDDEFQASVGDVTEVKVNATQAYLESSEGDLDLVPAYLSVKLYDDQGVDVTTRYIDGIRNDDPANILYTLTAEEYDKYNLLNYNEVEFYEMSVANVIAIYEGNGVYAQSTATPVSPKARNEYGVERVIDWTIVKNGDKPDWSATVKKVPAEEYDYILVTLLEDTRGEYYCTYEKGQEVKYNNKPVYWTEDETKPFWINGLFVEYKAMHMDKMLVETDGEIASYEEGNARFALYLYNQNNYGDKVFQRELLSQYVFVCHPRQLDYFGVSSNTIDIMKNTETEYQHHYDDDTRDEVPDAYYSEFSVEDLTVTQYDIHDEGKKKDKADKEDAETARFSLTLLTETTNTALQTLIERYEEDLNTAWAANPVSFKITIQADDFLAYNDVTDTYYYITGKNQVRFNITDATTKHTEKIVVNLISLVQDKVELDTDVDLDGKKDILYSDVDLIKEFLDVMQTEKYRYFEKFEVATRKVAVQQRIYEWSKDTTKAGYSILLQQPDARGNIIGYESDLWVADAKIVNNRLDVDHIIDSANLDLNDASRTVSVGDRVLVVTDKYGNVYPVIGQTYKNPIYKKLSYDNLTVPAVLESPETTDALGIFVQYADTATAASASALRSASNTAIETDFDKFQLVFRALNTASGEIIYASEGSYSAEIRTIEDFETVNGVTYAIFTRATGLSEKVTFTIANDNAQVAYASRDLTRVDEPIINYVDDETITKEIDNDPVIKKLILDAFNFTLGGAAWTEHDGKLTTDNILYYTYTVTPTNNQLVINEVVFKVGADEADKDQSGLANWYRSTATVNKSITFAE